MCDHLLISPRFSCTSSGREHAWIGRFTCTFLPNIISAGLRVVPSNGVQLQAKSASSVSTPASLVFFRILLTVFMALSTSPLLCAYVGLLNVC